MREEAEGRRLESEESGRGETEAGRGSGDEVAVADPGLRPAIPRQDPSRRQTLRGGPCCCRGRGRANEIGWRTSLASGFFGVRDSGQRGCSFEAWCPAEPWKGGRTLVGSGSGLAGLGRLRANGGAAGESIRGSVTARWSGFVGGGRGPMRLQHEGASRRSGGSETSIEWYGHEISPGIKY